MKIKKFVGRCELLPRFYGVAWLTWNRDGAICLPVPFNLIAGAARAVWVFLKNGGRSIPMNPRAAYDQGMRDGIKKYANDLIRRKDEPPRFKVEDRSGIRVVTDTWHGTDRQNER